MKDRSYNSSESSIDVDLNSNTNSSNPSTNTSTNPSSNPSYSEFDASAYASSETESTSAENVYQIKLEELFASQRYFDINDAVTLVEKGANPNTKGPRGRTLLHVIAAADELDAYPEELVRAIQVLKKFGATADCLDDRGLTPLEVALNNEFNFRPQVAMALVQGGADPNQEGAGGFSLLHHLVASCERYEEQTTAATIETLISKHGAMVDKTDDNNKTPLQHMLSYAAAQNSKYLGGTPFFSPIIAMTLVRAGADPDQLYSANGPSLLDRMMEHNSDDRCTPYIDELISKHYADHSRMKTPLQCIIDGNWEFSVTKALNLIKKGENANTKGEGGQTLLHRLVEVYDNQQAKDNEYVIQKIIDSHSARVDITNDDGLTPLQVLIDFGAEFDSYHANRDYFRGFFSAEIAMTLVRNGANPNLLSRSGRSLLNRLTAYNENEKYVAVIAELIHQHHVDTTNMKTALYYMINYDWDFSLERAMKCIRMGDNPNTKNNEGYTLLHYLVNSMDVADNDEVIIAAIQELVNQHGVLIDIRNNNNKTPLQVMLNTAVRYGFSPEIGMTLIRLGANPNQLSDNGKSFLQLLIQVNADGKLTKFITELVKTYHANINFTNAAGQTMLEEMIESKYTFDASKAVLLVRLGAKYDHMTLYHKIAGHDGPNSKALHELEMIADKHSVKSEILTTLYIVINAYFHPQSAQEFRNLHRDVLLHILSLYIVSELGNNYAEAHALAKTILKSRTTVKAMAQTPGGVNVSESTDPKTKKTVYTLYKSCHIFAKDYDIYHQSLNEKKLSNNDIEKKLSSFRAAAITYWHQHSSLYQKPMNKEKLKASIENRPAFADVKNQLKV